MQSLQAEVLQAHASMQHYPCKSRPFSRDRPVHGHRQAVNRLHNLSRVRAADPQRLQVSSSRHAASCVATTGKYACFSNFCQTLQTFPSDYPTAMRQAQTATLAALEDGHKLVEVEFPTSSLQGVSGTPLFLPMLHEYAPFLLFLAQHARSALVHILCLVFLKSMLVYIAPLERHHITCSSSHCYVRFKLKLDASPASGSICTLLKS